MRVFCGWINSVMGADYLANLIWDWEYSVLTIQRNLKTLIKFKRDLSGQFQEDVQ